MNELKAIKYLLKIFFEQAHLEFQNEEEKEIAEIIDYIDPSGLILEGLDEISKFSGYPIDVIKKILFRMQKFEPSIVFAKNIKECLKLQLKNSESLNKTNELLINNLELLGNGNLKQLQKLQVCQMKI